MRLHAPLACGIVIASRQADERDNQPRGRANTPRSK
nr:MAG TPA: hypothetical protein [Caudoviricetes sp.]